MIFIRKETYAKKARDMAGHAISYFNLFMVRLRASWRQKTRDQLGLKHGELKDFLIAGEDTFRRVSMDHACMCAFLEMKGLMKKYERFQEVVWPRPKEGK